jgi:hypothetical protein
MTVSATSDGHAANSEEPEPGSRTGSVPASWRRRRSLLQRAGSVTESVFYLLRNLRDLRTRLDDVVANQAVLTEALGEIQLKGLARGAEDPPLSSRVCRQADFGSEYVEWMQKMGRPMIAFRKEWEHVAICRALAAAGLLRPGIRGLGFGVGREPLVSVFAAHGVEVVATDLAADDGRAAVWASTGQHSLSMSALRNPQVCPDDVLEKLVTIRPVDMAAIPDDLRGFDFLWSACAFEHLGSLEAGMDFVEQAMACLVPGGLAVHTTEFNLDSNEMTVADGPVVAYRKRDLDLLRDRLGRLGHSMAALSVGTRDGVLDRVLDMPPYQRRSLALRLGPYRITSAVIVIQAGGNGPPPAVIDSDQS